MKTEYEVCREFADRASDKVDIVDVISDFIILQKTENHFKGMCPFHETDQPTFWVSRIHQSFLCETCNVQGDYFDFLVRIQQSEVEEIDYLEVFKRIYNDYLLSKAGLAIAGTGTARLESEMYAAHEQMTQEYHRILLEAEEAKEARSYLASRGIGMDAIKHFKIGFAPDSFHTAKGFLSQFNYAKKMLVQSGILAENDNERVYDRFRNRIMFPIYDLSGKVIAFGGRAIGDAQPKYLNSPDSLIFQKGLTFYGMHQALQNKETPLVLMEGYLDVVSAWQAGCLTATATMGTSMTLSHARALQKESSIIICYDGDVAGKAALLKAVSCLEEFEVYAKVVDLPDQLDPDELIRSRGSNEFHRLLQQAEKVEDFIKKGNEAKHSSLSLMSFIDGLSLPK